MRGWLVALGIAVMLLGLVVAIFFLPPRGLPCPSGYEEVGTRQVFIFKTCPCLCEAIHPDEEGIRSIVSQEGDGRMPLRIAVFATGMLAGLGLGIIGIRTKR